MTHQQIADTIDISIEMVQGINTGRYWKRDIHYPIQTRTIRTSKIPRFCSKCGQPIDDKNISGLCLQCFNDEHRAVLPLPLNDFLLLIYNKSFAEVGRMYHVSDNTIRKWLKKYDIPVLRKDFRAYVEQNILSIPKKTEDKQPKPLRIQVEQLDLEGNVIATFKSISDAARALGDVNYNSHISSACKGKRETAYGYRWRYKE